MTQIWKRGIALLVAAVLALCLLGAIPGTAPEAQAASASHMKSLNLKWDLKKNKAVAFKTSWPGAGFQSMTATIKNYKVTKASKKGYKKLTLTVVFNNKFNPSSKQLKAMSNTVGDWNLTWGTAWLTAVDYTTGKCLEAKNKHGVTVKFGNWKIEGGKKFKNIENGTIQVYKKATCKVTITYPTNYKGLCIGIGGDNDHYGSYVEDNYNDSDFIPKDKEGLFWTGKAPFGKTSLYDWKLKYRSDLGKSQFYAKSKTNSHWMRVK